MTTTTYSIDCGVHHSVLAARGDVSGHATLADALAALARICVEQPVAVDIGEEWLVYASQAAADADDEGVDAIGSIRRVVA